MDIIYRHFESKDFLPTFDFFKIYGVAYDFTSRMWKRQMLLDPNFDANWFIIAESEGKIVGLIYVIRRCVPIDVGGDLECDKAWINGFAVLPEYLSEVGSRLIDIAENLARNNGAKTLTATSYTPNYFTQGIDMVHFPDYAMLFENKGYKLEETSNSMKLNLMDYSYSEKAARLKKQLKEEKITFSTLSEDSIYALIEYMYEYSKPGWMCRLRKLLLGTDDLSRVHIAKAGDKVIGFNMYGDVDTDIKRFGPFGVNPEYTGKGIGRVLLEECLLDMKKAGHSYAWLSWASGERAPILYRSIGFNITGIYNTYVKKL
ncbi:MAG: GNAT family N-acetyltransferase [Oscillospiraceae bacterium]|nr:GNAT family N-acetyltransferase [Oscillospiraceae bacterium]